MRWFGHVERVDERKLTKEIYEVDSGGNAVMEERIILNQIRQVLDKNQVKSTRNRRACMRNLMKIEEFRFFYFHQIPPSIPSRFSFSLCLIHREGLCAGSGDINRLMMINYK
jgi:hypothetical protein